VLPSVQVPAAYETAWGRAFCADARWLLSQLPPDSVDLVFTSPPYALLTQKAYGNESSSKYLRWFEPFARGVQRVLRSTGSFVVNIGGAYQRGTPTRSLVHLELPLRMCREWGWHLAQECFWYSPTKLPMPAEWVTVRRLRLKDATELVYWFSKTPWPKADTRRVLQPYSEAMRDLISTGRRLRRSPSGHVVGEGFAQDLGGSIPSNMLTLSHSEATSEYLRRCKAVGLKPHPARFPGALPEFFVKLLTEPGDCVLDIFAGSNTTGRIAEDLQRHWLSVEREPSYVQGSRLRFDPPGKWLYNLPGRVGLSEEELDRAVQL